MYYHSDFSVITMQVYDYIIKCKFFSLLFEISYYHSDFSVISMQVYDYLIIKLLSIIFNSLYYVFTFSIPTMCHSMRKKASPLEAKLISFANSWTQIRPDKMSGLIWTQSV